MIGDIYKPRKEDPRAFYNTLKDMNSASQIFRRATIIRNENLRVSNFIAPQYFVRCSAI